MPATETRPALTIDSAIAHGLRAEVVPASTNRSRLHITAKRAGEILRFIAACGMDCIKEEGPTTRHWIVRDQRGEYRGSVITADCAPDYALFSGAES